MSADLDGDMAPVTVEYVERVVIDIRRPPLKVIIRPCVPHRGLGPADQHQKPTFSDGCLGQIIVGYVVLALPCPAVDNRNVVRLGIASCASAEPAG